MEEFTVHEFEQFVHHSFQKLPMGTKKARVLTDDVHNVRGDDRLVIFATLLLAQAE